ncbi:hypothetical protein [Actinomadura rubrisoli]|uniref:Uncharacterized protein n=1 Tax=Actinomadura rubrisoli TaxID=2530368 RepID=A0A4V2YYJ7_9ACTN|nr:hypothetical protein [Actinomadura rubrisoli]TDD93427.1 hypothetical protein E1298_09380 [Actinomadura rubrisoli]
MIRIRRKPQEEVLTRLGRAQEAARHGAEVCRQSASAAAERIGPVATERVLAARGWGAPRLRQAAGYVETGLAPRVSTFLSDVAHRVEPPKANRPRRAPLMAMMGAVAALGVAGVVMTRRSAMRDIAGDSGGRDGSATSADSMTVSGTDADGQVHSPH